MELRACADESACLQLLPLGFCKSRARSLTGLPACLFASWRSGLVMMMMIMMEAVAAFSSRSASGCASADCLLRRQRHRRRRRRATSCFARAQAPVAPTPGEPDGNSRRNGPPQANAGSCCRRRLFVVLYSSNGWMVLMCTSLLAARRHRRAESARAFPGGLKAGERASERTNALERKTNARADGHARHANGSGHSQAR